MRYLLPFLFAALALGYPSISYFIGRSRGELPTQAEWDSAAHSSSPWAHEFVIFFLGTLFLGLVIHFLTITISLTLKNKSQAFRWSIGLVALVVAAGFSFYQFGYLME
jgi:hypothetical protein